MMWEQSILPLVSFPYASQFGFLGSKRKVREHLNHRKDWQGRQDSNLRPPVLETGALPTELHPYLAPNIRSGPSAMSSGGSSAPTG